MRTIVLRLTIGLAVLCGVAVCALMVFLLQYHRTTVNYFAPPLEKHPFAIQSIDTMKVSRDMAGQIRDTPHSFISKIDAQVRLIAEAGATHVAIATPYDARFLPVLRLWVASARSHGLSVWFRGNFAGWEGWFDYPRIDRNTHRQLLQTFVRDNPELFQNGDVFTPCPECENGGPGDPRQTGDTSGYNAFLVEEKKMAATEFAIQNKYVAIYPSMNADIARDVITKSTVTAFGGTILIDHYVRDAQTFANDIRAIPKKLGASVGLGEVGAPIPDLQGELSQAEQASYVDALFRALYEARKDIPVVNYWTLSGGSTKLLNDNGVPRAVYTTVQNYFNAFNVYGVVYNSLGETVADAVVHIDGTAYETTANGTYQIFVPRHYTSVTVSADGYAPVTVTLPTHGTTTTITRDIRLAPLHPDWWYRVRASLYARFF